MRSKRALVSALCLIAIAAPVLVFAAGDFGLGTAAGGAGLSNRKLPEIIGSIIKTALSFLGILFLLLTLYAGFLYMTARGDEKKVSTAKNILVGAVIGMVIIASSYAITTFVIDAVTGKETPAQTSGSGAGSGIPLGGACHNTSDCQGALVCENEKCIDSTAAPTGCPDPSSATIGSIPNGCPCTSGSQCGSASICTGTLTSPGVCS